MQVDSSTSTGTFSMDQSNGGGAQVQSIRVSFNPVTPQDTTLSGMTRWMLQELGVGVGVNMLA